MTSSSEGTVVGTDTSVRDLEKDDKPLVDEYNEEEFPLPEKSGFHGWRWVRHTAFSAYRKLFGFIFLTNLIVLIALLVDSRDNNYYPKPTHVATAVASNLLAAVLIRQEYVVNAIFFTCFQHLSPSLSDATLREFIITVVFTLAVLFLPQLGGSCTPFPSAEISSARSTQLRSSLSSSL
jgi:hypothetical protein